MFFPVKKKNENNSGNGMGPKRKSLTNISRNLRSGGSNMGLRVLSINRPPNLNPIRRNRVRYNRVQNNIVLSNGTSLMGKNRIQMNTLKNKKIFEQRLAYGVNSPKFFAMKNDVQKIQNAMYNLA